MLAKGDKVPPNLKGILVEPNAENHKSVSLSSLWKNELLVLFFYPRDNTPGCTVEACNFRDHSSEIKNLKANLIGVSRDNAQSHAKFIQKQNLNFPLLVDEGPISEAFGVWAEKKMAGKTFMGIIRSTFIIEKGKVIQDFPKVKPKDHFKEVLDFLEKFNQ